MVEVCEMVYSKVSRRPVRWVLVVAQDSKVEKPEDLAGGVISTELVGFTQRYFAERNIPVTVEFSWGATEAKVVEGLCDAIVDVITSYSIHYTKLYDLFWRVSTDRRRPLCWQP